MQAQVSRAIARNLVIAATMGLAVVASWAVAGVARPAVEVRTVDACVAGDAVSGVQAPCKPALPQS